MSSDAMASDEEKGTKSCFAVDGVVAEMDIEVESHDQGLDDANHAPCASEKSSFNIEEPKQANSEPNKNGEKSSQESDSASSEKDCRKEDDSSNSSESLIEVPKVRPTDENELFARKRERSPNQDKPESDEDSEKPSQEFDKDGEKSSQESDSGSFEKDSGKEEAKDESDNSESLIEAAEVRLTDVKKLIGIKGNLVQDKSESEEDCEKSIQESDSACAEKVDEKEESKDESDNSESLAKVVASRKTDVKKLDERKWQSSPNQNKTESDKDSEKPSQESDSASAEKDDEKEEPKDESDNSDSVKVRSTDRKKLFSRKRRRNLKQEKTESDKNSDMPSQESDSASAEKDDGKEASKDESDNSESAEVRPTDRKKLFLRKRTRNLKQEKTEFDKVSDKPSQEFDSASAENNGKEASKDESDNSGSAEVRPTDRKKLFLRKRTRNLIQEKTEFDKVSDKPSQESGSASAEKDDGKEASKDESDNSESAEVRPTDRKKLFLRKRTRNLKQEKTKFDKVSDKPSQESGSASAEKDDGKEPSKDESDNSENAVVRPTDRKKLFLRKRTRNLTQEKIDFDKVSKRPTQEPNSAFVEKGNKGSPKDESDDSESLTEVVEVRPTDGKKLVGRKRKRKAVYSKKKYPIEVTTIEKLAKRRFADSETSNSSKGGRKRRKENDLKDGSSNAAKTEVVDSKANGDSKAKQDTLRKFPWRKNKDAPDVPDLKPKVLWWNDVGEGKGQKLGNLVGIRERIKSSRSVRPLFRILYFQWPPNGIDLIDQILKFNGFPFDETSYEYSKRQSMMKIMLDVTISNVAEILGLKVCAKKDMIDDILRFLLRPHGEIDPSHDLSLQPKIVLERLKLDRKVLSDTLEYYRKKKETLSEKKSSKAAKKAPAVEPVRETRQTIQKRPAESAQEPADPPPKKIPKPNPKIKMPPPMMDPKPVRERKLPSKLMDMVDPLAKSSDKSKASIKGNMHSYVRTATQPSEFKSNVSLTSNVQKATKLKPDDKTGITKKVKVQSKREVVKSDDNIDSSLSSSSCSDSENDISEIKRKIKLLKQKIKKKKTLQKLKDKEGKLQKKAEEMEKETAAKNKGSKKVKAETPAVDSSETESSDETKQIISPKKTKASKVRIGKPLKSFPKIVESIQNASFSALQRLHILLFGASDKAENLKSNILAFGGFPFLEGSEDWKQKHFLLSLLAQNNLKEYLTLMCIESKDEDQTTMINKLMKFLAAPTPGAMAAAGRGEKGSNQKSQKPPTVPKGPKHRKVLMSEEEARELEEKFAQEQKALEEARLEKLKKEAEFNMLAKSNPVVTINTPLVLVDHKNPNTYQKVAYKKAPTNPVNINQLNALLQTVYKRRALKAAGAVISIPNKGQKVKLGEIENIKFLVVTSNIRDLELLHRLIFLSDCFKSRVRKNILDFSGFDFTEDSFKYKERMDFLNELGYDVSKRLSFLLGLCPLQTNIPQQDLNELIMYFLMSPTKTKEVVPITQMPSVDSGEYVATIERNHVILKPRSVNDNAGIQSLSASKVQPLPTSTAPVPSVLSVPSADQLLTSTPLPPGTGPRAKKSFGPPAPSSTPIRKVLLAPHLGSPILPTSLKLLGAFRATSSGPEQPVQTMVQQTLVGAEAPTATTFQAIAPKPATPKSTVAPTPRTTSANTLQKLQLVNAGMNLKDISMQSNVAVLDTARKEAVHPVTQKPPLLLSGSSGGDQEFIVHQQTPDGKQKTFKLIRLPANHPLATVVKPSTLKPVQVPVQIVTSPTAKPPTVPLSSLPPGFVIMKDQLQGAKTSPKVLQSVPLPIAKTTGSGNTGNILVSSVREQSDDNSFNDPDDPDVELLDSSNEQPPSNSDLFIAIQEIILSANFENITLRNVIDKVTAQFPNHDLTSRHNYMKECVKKIIIGTA